MIWNVEPNSYEMYVSAVGRATSDQDGSCGGGGAERGGGKGFTSHAVTGVVTAAPIDVILKTTGANHLHPQLRQGCR